MKKIWAHLEIRQNTDIIKDSKRKSNSKYKTNELYT